MPYQLWQAERDHFAAHLSASIGKLCGRSHKRNLIPLVSMFFPSKSGRFHKARDLGTHRKRRNRLSATPRDRSYGFRARRPSTHCRDQPACGPAKCRGSEKGIAANHAIGFCAKRPSPMVQLNESKWRFLRIAAWPMSRRHPTDTCPSSYAPPSQIGQFKVNFRRLRAPATTFKPVRSRR